LEERDSPAAGRDDAWLRAFDETLAGLAAERPLGEILGEILRLAARALGAPHGFVLARHADPERRHELVGLGAWAATPPTEIAHRVAETGGALRLAAAPLVGAVVAIPMRTRPDVAAVGALGLAHDAGGSGFDPDAAERLLRFAQVGAVAFENERLMSAERAVRRQEQALRAATQVLSATLRLQEVLAAILHELQNVVPHDTASVQQLQGDRMVIVGGRGIDLDHFLGFGFPAFGGGVPNADVLRRRTPVIVPDILGEHPYPDFPNSNHALSGVRSWMGVPLLFGNRCSGMLTLDKLEPGFYTARHAEDALAFAAQAAIAIENARLYEQSQREVAERRRAEDELREANRRLQVQIGEVEALQGKLREQAIRDPLTGLYNRRFFTETLQRELARSRREGRALSLAMIDLDHFKDVNDAHGHEGGDRALEAFGTFLLERTRGGDIACRYGGEEFVVLLPGAPGPAASARAEDWRVALQELRVPHAGKSLALTVSIGVAEFPAHALSADDLLRIADVALYQAKREGRNRVVLAR
jgi:diguanylate cyclase (GGDEF)-like protein